MRTVLWYYSAAEIINHEQAVKKAVNKTGGILHRSWVAIPNESFHDCSTAIKIVDNPGQIIYWPDFIAEMHHIADADAAVYDMYNR